MHILLNKTPTTLGLMGGVCDAGAHEPEWDTMCYFMRPRNHCQPEQHCKRLCTYQEASVALVSQEQSPFSWHWTSLEVPCMHATSQMSTGESVVNLWIAPSQSVRHGPYTVLTMPSLHL